MAIYATERPVRLGNVNYTDAVAYDENYIARRSFGATVKCSTNYFLASITVPESYGDEIKHIT